jgi:hypothetical protein
MRATPRQANMAAPPGGLGLVVVLASLFGCSLSFDMSILLLFAVKFYSKKIYAQKIAFVA